MGVRGYNNTRESKYRVVANISKNRMNKNVDFCVINAVIILWSNFKSKVILRLTCNYEINE
jgi:hypothetical protein